MCFVYVAGVKVQQTAAHGCFHQNKIINIISTTCTYLFCLLYFLYTVEHDLHCAALLRRVFCHSSSRVVAPMPPPPPPAPGDHRFRTAESEGEASGECPKGWATAATVTRCRVYQQRCVERQTIAKRHMHRASSRPAIEREVVVEILSPYRVGPASSSSPTAGGRWANFPIFSFLEKSKRLPMGFYEQRIGGDNDV